MYQIGDQVVYGIHGVCRVTAMEERMVDRERRTYLVLEPEEKDGSRFLVPTHNENAMGKIRRMYSREELEALLQSEEIRGGSWITDENQRKQLYRELIGSGDRVKLLRMVHVLYGHQQTQKLAGRKCHLCDENFLRDAEKLLSSEFAAVMGVAFQEAKSYIRQQLMP